VILPLAIQSQIEVAVVLPKKPDAGLCVGNSFVACGKDGNLCLSGRAAPFPSCGRVCGQIGRAKLSVGSSPLTSNREFVSNQ
jgi:hypothetical protein